MGDATQAVTTPPSSQHQCPYWHGRHVWSAPWGRGTNLYRCNCGAEMIGGSW